MADDLARVDALIDDLLAAHDPKTTDLVDVPRRAVRPRPRVGALPRGLRRPRTSRRIVQRHIDAGCREAGAPPPHGTLLLRPLPRGPDDGDARQRRAAQARAAADVHRRGDLVPAVLRARRGLRPRRPRDALRARRRRVGRQRAEGVEHARAPRRPGHARRAHRSRAARSTRASRTSWSTCTRPASRCDRCARSPARPSSTRCTSPTRASPTPIASATSATAGASR